MSRTVTDAATAASERARIMPLSPVDPPAAVSRALEDAALARIDAEAARRLVDLDRRFDRTVSALRQELARRQELAEEAPVARPAWGWDAVGMFLALGAAPLLLAGGGPVGGFALPATAASWWAAGLVVAAATAHLIGALRARRTGSNVAPSRHLVLLGAIESLAVVALVAWRSMRELEVVAVPVVALAGAAAVTCLVLFVRASAAARADDRARRAEREAERRRRADLEARLREAIDAASAASRTVLDGLSDADRSQLRAAVTAAVAVLGRRQLLEPAVLRELRTAEAGQLRYDVDL